MQTPEHVVRGVAFCSRDLALHPVIGWSMLTAGSVAKKWGDKCPPSML